MRHFLFLGLALLTSADVLAQSGPVYLGASNCRILDPTPKIEKTISWTGACKDGYADGAGVLQWIIKGEPGDRYEGTLAKGMPDGPGMFSYSNHGSFKGSFTAGKRQGEGVVTYPNGSKLVAVFDQGIVIGEVDFNFVNGDRYHGEWRNGFNGKGVMVYALGGSYEGQWLRGRPNGRGAIIYPGGARREGEFRDGVIVGSVGANAVADTVIDRAAPPVTPTTYDVKRDDPFTGSAIKRTQITGAEVPLDKPYQDLTPEQQAAVKKHYPILQEGDEPPYPLYGPVAMEKALLKAAGKLRVDGELWLYVLIDGDGTPVSVAVLKSPDPELSNFTAAAMMLEKYKPAICAGKPCAMSFSVNMTVHLTRR
jgi:hypothetical protein